MYMDQITYAGSLQIKPWCEIRNSDNDTNKKGRPPRWHSILSKRATFDPAMTTAAIQNGHTRKWKESTENFTEIRTLTNEHEVVKNDIILHIDIEDDEIEPWMKLKAALSKVAEEKQELNFYTDGSIDKTENEELIPKMAAA